MDYNFTATVEKDFDAIAEGAKQWAEPISAFYKDFEPQINNILQTRSEYKVGERLLGTDPSSGKPVSVKIGRFGPIVQIGTSSDEEKPRFAQMKPGQTLETITLKEALDLFCLPRTLGEFENNEITVGAGRFGPYIKHKDAYVSIPKNNDPIKITLEEAIELIQAKRKAEAEKIIKTFEEEPELQVLNGRFGPYIAYKGSNYKLPKNIIPAELSSEKCLEIITQQNSESASSKGRRKYVKKKQ